jgi:hypothetical protein
MGEKFFFGSFGKQPGRRAGRLQSFGTRHYGDSSRNFKAFSGLFAGPPGREKP